MKIKNEYVKIKIGDKEIIKHNMILNNYLKYIVDSQFGIEGSKTNATISKIGIRLDTPLDVNENSELIMNFTTFQLQFFYPKVSFSKTPNSLKINYYADDSNKIVYNGKEMFTTELEELNGKKITGIAFGDYIKALTYLDTTEYDLVFDNRVILEVSRLDIMATDGICTGDLDYPFHLCQRTCQEFDEIGNQLFCSLYAIGFGLQPRTIIEEYIIGEHVNVIRKDDYSYSFEIENIGYPYLFYEYRLYYIDKDTKEKIYTNKYYSVSLKTDKIGKIKGYTRIERNS